MSWTSASDAAAHVYPSGMPDPDGDVIEGLHALTLACWGRGGAYQGTKSELLELLDKARTAVDTLPDDD